MPAYELKIRCVYDSHMLKFITYAISIRLSLHLVVMWTFFFVSLSCSETFFGIQVILFYDSILIVCY